jgi:hypothetical protein
VLHVGVDDPRNGGGYRNEEQADRRSDTFGEVCERANEYATDQPTEINVRLKVGDLLRRILEDGFLVLEDGREPEEEYEHANSRAGKRHGVDSDSRHLPCSEEVVVHYRCLHFLLFSTLVKIS